MIDWPMLDLQPINLFNLPAHLKKQCKHTHWAMYVSWGKRTCIDCGIDKPLYDIEIKHQR